VIAKWTFHEGTRMLWIRSLQRVHKVQKHANSVQNKVCRAQGSAAAELARAFGN
jgi:hypothetical protein